MPGLDASVKAEVTGVPL